jgi:indole-3-glycerol phosphate synthase
LREIFFTQRRQAAKPQSSNVGNTTSTVETRIEQPGLLRAGGVLDLIVEAKAGRLDEAKRRAPIGEVAAKALSLAALPGERSFAAALRRRDRVNVIAEIKQRSPSKGIICEDFDPARIAESYASGGAAALSVLCEEDFFGGSLEHLEAVRGVGPPLLRKDFIFDAYQLYESRVAGADAVLLIVALLEDDLLARLIGLANELGLDALVEVHSADEMMRAARAGASIIGINNRDLTTFNVDLDTSIQLAPLAPEDAILVSESGINTGSDIRRLRSAGFSAFLVGEHLMRAQHPSEALRRLIEEA